MILRVDLRCVCGARLVEVERACDKEPKGHPHIRCVALSCVRAMPAKWAACVRVTAVQAEDGTLIPIERVVITTEAS